MRRALGACGARRQVDILHGVGWIMKTHDTSDYAIAEPDGAVGIVVHDGGRSEGRPRAVAFVWGGKVRPAPSLPYGRWKKVLNPAL